LELFDQRLEDLKGMRCYNFFYDTDVPCDTGNCPLVRVLRTRQGQTLPWRKGNRWEDRVFSPILDDNGDVAYVIESIRDVTRIKQLESELSDIKEMISRVVHSSASAIVAADRQGRIQLMNPAAKELFKVGDREAGMFENAADLYPEGKAREIMRMLRDENMGGGKGKLSGAPTTIVAADGEEIPVEMSAAIVYDDDDQEAATMAIYNDLRKKLEIEEQLKDAQKQLAQSEKMASLGQLAAGVAHEINNPLTGILLYASFIMEQLDADSPVKKDLECIVEDANRCKEIVKSLLVYSRSTDSRRSLIQVNELVEQSFKLTRDQKTFRNIEINKQLSDEMMLLNVDTNKLSQVIINLVMNAADAMDGQGTLTVRTYRNKAAQKVYLEISDTGCGIAEQNVSRIFDPFFSTKAKGKGTGLGLSIAYGIVEEHGGRISVKETGPEGTTFLLELPQYIPAEE
ncbi:MAG: ATP-binding protein, partial [Desulfobacterales bacterium]